MENIYLTGESAIALLLSSRMKQFDADFEFSLGLTRSEHNFMAYLRGLMPLPPLTSVHKCVPRIKQREAQTLADDLKTALPLEASVASLSVRRNSKNLKCSVLPLAVQQGAFFQVGEGLYCATPETALLSVATRDTDIELVILMSLMFSVFAKDAATGKLVPRRSLATPDSVNAFLSRCEQTGVKLPDGLQRLKRLVPQAVVKAASPKEIESALRLGRSTEQGGCGFGLPEMNAQIDIPHSNRKRYCDLYWPDRNVAVEYLGAEEHSVLGALEADAQHRNDLTLAGVPQFQITADQLRTITSFDRTARQIERLMEHPNRFPSDALFHDKQRTLKAEIDAAFARFGF